MADESTATEQLDEEQEQEHEQRLDPEVAARRQAALRLVRQWGDPVLKSSARAVERFDDDLRTQIEQMGRIMEDSLGIGLAATQLGKLQRVLVYRVEPDSPVNAVVNPAIEWSGDELETAEEGCLSLQGVLVDVERPLHVRVRAQDEHGEPITIEASGLEARVLQHEIDHLDGVLILDRTSRDQRKAAMRILREAADQAA
jgi:peptide deformylase